MRELWLWRVVIVVCELLKVLALLLTVGGGSEVLVVKTGLNVGLLWLDESSSGHLTITCLCLAGRSSVQGSAMEV